MEEINKSTNKLELSQVISFLVLEVLALTAFNLGNSFILFSIISLLVAILLCIVIRKDLKQIGYSSYIYFLFPLIMFGVLSAVSSFANQDPRYSLSLFGRILIPFGLLAFSICGYFVSATKTFSLKKALVVIYSALAILTLINLVDTMIEFSPFYTIIYRGKYIYYMGKPLDVPVNKMAFSLIGFTFNETSITYFSLYPSILISAFGPLLFIKPKEEKKLFILLFSCFLLGAITLILTINIQVLLTDFLIVVIMIFIIGITKYKWNKKAIKIILSILFVLFLFAVIVLYLNAQTGVTSGFIANIQNIIKSNKILNKLFNNHLCKAYGNILDNLFSMEKFFGFPVMFDSYFHADGIYPSGSWFFDTIMTSSFFGLVLFIFALVIGVKELILYYKKDTDSKMEKVGIISFIFVLLGYSLINFDVTPYIFKETTVPFYTNGCFLIMIFLFSYVIYKGFIIKAQIKKEEIKEEIKNEEAEI